MPLRCFAGHTLAVQKKTLNRLKMSQIQRLTTGLNAESETSHNDDKQMPNEQPTPVLARSSGSTSDAEVSEVNYCLLIDLVILCQGIIQRNITINNLTATAKVVGS